MEIKVKNDKVTATFEIDEDANINDAMDIIVAAFVADGYLISSIADGLRSKAESMELENE